jgi:hypothetical protein
VFGLRVGFSGSRDYKNLLVPFAHVGDLYKKYGTDLDVYVGDARGVDAAVWKACTNMQIAPRHAFRIEANVKMLGSPAAFHVRNDRILDSVELLVVYWDGKSPGSYSMIKKAMERGLNFMVFFDRPLEAQPRL